MRSRTPKPAKRPSNRIRSAKRFGAGFELLEPRCLLAVDGMFVSGSLTVDVTSGGTSNIAVLRDQGSNSTLFFLDENGNGVFDVSSEVGGLKSALKNVDIHFGLTDSKDAGAFEWLNDFRTNPNDTTSPYLLRDFNVQSTPVGNTSVLMKAVSTVVNDSKIEATNSVMFGGDVDFKGNLSVSVMGAFGMISNAASARMHINGHLELAATNIDIGNAVADFFVAGSLNFESAGGVNIDSDGPLEVVAIKTQRNAAGNLMLTSIGGLSVLSSTGITVAKDVELRAVTGNISTGRITSTNGSVLVESSEGDIAVGHVVSFLDTLIRSVKGKIREANNINQTDENIRAGGVITMQSMQDIDSPSEDGRLKLAPGSVVFASSQHGNIMLRGLGDLTLENLVTSTGLIDIVSEGNLKAMRVVSDADSVPHYIALVSSSGDIRLQNVKAGASNGDVAITANGNIVDLDSPEDDVDVTGRNITLTALNGNIGSLTSDIFTAKPEDIAHPSANDVNPIEVTASGSYSANAIIGMIALDIGDVAVVTLNTHTAWIQSKSDIDTSAFGFGVFDVNNLALVADVDGNGSGSLALPNVIRLSGDLRIQGSDVSAADGSIDISAHRLLFESHQSEIVFVTANYLDIKAKGNITVFAIGDTNLVDLNLDSFAAKTDVSGYIAIVINNGDLTVTDNILATNGNVLLRTTESFGDILINSKIQSTNGDLSIFADDDLEVRNTIVAEGTGTVYLLAGNARADSTRDGIDMNSLGSVKTNNANVILEAKNLGNVSLGFVDAGNADVAILADHSITAPNGTRALTANSLAGSNQATLASVESLAVGDKVIIARFDAATTLNSAPSNTEEILTISGIAGNKIQFNETLSNSYFVGELAAISLVNIHAKKLALNAKNGVVGDRDTSTAIVRNRQAVVTQVDSLSAMASQGIHVHELDGLIVDSVGTIGVRVPDINGLTHDFNAAGSSFLGTSLEGPIEIQSATGDLVLNQVIAAGGTGDVLLQTLGASGDITVNAPVISSAGRISLVAFDDINLSSTVSTSGSGTIYLASGLGSVTSTHDVTMNGGSLISTSNKNVYIDANGNTSLNLIDARKGDVSLKASGSIYDGKSDENVNIIARNLRLEAGVSIGLSNLFNGNADAKKNAIDTQVELLAAQSSTGIYIHEFDGMDVNTFSGDPAFVQVVNFNSTLSDIPVSSLDGLATTTSAPIWIESDSGDITIARPTLVLSVDHNSIPESGGTATGKIHRNRSIDSDLLVRLYSSDATEATVPRSVIIPKGFADVFFSIDSVIDGIGDGDQRVLVSAQCDGFSNWNSEIIVRDDGLWSWTNFQNPLDVDNDRGVSPLDVLTLINDINQLGTRRLASSTTRPFAFLDVNQDGNISPLDVLMVINNLNQSSSNGEGEASGVVKYRGVLPEELTLVAPNVIDLVFSKFGVLTRRKR